MKIGVIGDSHNNFLDLRRAMGQLKDVDIIIHTGDHYEDTDFIVKNYDKKVFAVRGNCDYVGEAEQLILINNKKIYVSHGHSFNVKYSLNNIYYRGLELEVDIIIFGHTHIPYNATLENIMLFNPGSVSIPRGGSKKSFGLIEISDTVVAKHMSLE